MPSGKTHDGLTLILAIPTFAAGYEVSLSVPISVVLAVFHLERARAGFLARAR